MKTINPTWIIDKNEAYFISKVNQTKVYVTELYAESGQKEEYQQVMDYCNALIASIQDVTDEYVGDV